MKTHCQVAFYFSCSMKVLVAGVTTHQAKHNKGYSARPNGTASQNRWPYRKRLSNIGCVLLAQQNCPWDEATGLHQSKQVDTLQSKKKELTEIIDSTQVTPTARGQKSKVCPVQRKFVSTTVPLSLSYTSQHRKVLIFSPWKSSLVKELVRFSDQASWVEFAHIILWFTSFHKTRPNFKDVHRQYTVMLGKTRYLQKYFKQIPKKGWHHTPGAFGERESGAFIDSNSKHKLSNRVVNAHWDPLGGGSHERFSQCTIEPREEFLDPPLKLPFKRLQKYSVSSTDTHRFNFHSF